MVVFPLLLELTKDSGEFRSDALLSFWFPIPGGISETRIRVIDRQRARAEIVQDAWGCLR